MKALFTITAVLTALLGVTWLLAPEAMADSGPCRPTPWASTCHGATPGSSSATRPSCGSAAGRPNRSPAILAGGMVVTGLVTAVSLYGVLAGLVGPVAWTAVVIEIGLLSGFAYFYFGTK